ncbi:MAG: hypothetical protein AAGG45_06600 [Pseudomonadota bacterium]
MSTNVLYPSEAPASVSTDTYWFVHIHLHLLMSENADTPKSTIALALKRASGSAAGDCDYQ